MPDVTIDIPVNQDLQDALNILSCDVSELGIQASGLTGIMTPMGFELPALRNLGASIPDDCALTFSLMLQLTPFLASITCLLRILALIGPLMDVVTSPPPTPDAVKKLLKAVADLEPCLGMILPVNLLPFIRDVLCLIRAVCNCLATNLKSVQNLMSNIELRIGEAQGNPDLLKTLGCAQKNAQASAANLNQAIEPISTLMAMITPVFKLAGQNVQFSPPAIGPAPQVAAELTPIIVTLQGVVTIIDDILDNLGLSCAG